MFDTGLLDSCSQWNIPFGSGSNRGLIEAVISDLNADLGRLGCKDQGEVRNFSARGRRVASYISFRRPNLILTPCRVSMSIMSPGEYA